MAVASSLQAAGAAFAYLGAYMLQSYDTFNSFIQDRQALIPAIIIIGVSVVMFFFGLVGCCATLRESKVGLSFVSVCVFTSRFCFNFHPVSLRLARYFCLTSSQPLVSPVFPDHHGDLCS